MIYLVLFTFSLLFLLIALTYSGRVSKFFLVLSILLPCLIAGLRGNTVGTDMKAYIIRYFSLAQKANSFGNYVQMVEVSDYLYLLINYVVSRITSLFWIELFIQQGLVIVPLYVALFRIFNNKKSIFLGVALYFLFMYNFSLNIARQSIAISFEILGFSYLKEKNYKFVICIIVSIMFHNTAIVTLLPFFIYFIYNSKYFSPKFKLFISLCACVCCVLVLYFITNILPLFSNSSVMVLRRLAGNMSFLKKEIDISISDFLVCVICILFSFLYRKKTYIFCYDINYFVVIAILGSILSQTGSIITHSQRASYYFLYPVIFIGLPYTVSETLRTHEKFHPERWILFFFFCWWCFNILICNFSETLPYVFFFS